MNSLERNDQRGDRYPAITFSRKTYRTPTVNVDLRGRGHASKVRRAVRDALKNRAEVLENYEQSPLLVASIESVARVKPEKRLLLPHRRASTEMDSYAGPPMMSQVVFKAGRIRTLQRLFIYVSATLRWYMQRLWDKLRRRDTVERRAARLRNIIEKEVGGTAVKVGQQMAMRIDLMPYVYGVELSKMLDKVPAFETKVAVKAIEMATGRPLNETFAEFDPEPIGSASVACVYKAVLKTGETVAVKVRRPGIGEIFVADCQALAWIFRVLEFLTLIRPGLSHNFVFEFRNMLIEELDFVKEARHTELFRRRARKKLHGVTAPKVYFDLSSDDILVMEYVTGVWLGDMIAYVEQKDEAALAQLRRLNIEPEMVAKRLIRVNQFGIFENLLFHADPHPSNVLVRPDNTLVFIDFGSVGAYTTKERNNWRQLAHYQHKEDVGRMVQSALAILEPLPPVDLDEFSKRLETVFWQDLYAFKSKHAQWYERTSARIWISFLGLAREYNMPMNLNTLRMIRSTLLYETVAARLYHKIDAWREHRRYNKSAGKRARKRVRRSVHKRLFEGLKKTDYLGIEQLMGMANRTVYLFQRHLDTPLYRFSLLISKAVYAVTRAFKLVLTFITISLFMAFVAIGIDMYRSGAFQSWEAFLKYLDADFMRVHLKYLLFESRWAILYWAAVAFSILLNSRRILFRLWDKDIRRDNTSGLN